MNLLQQVSGHNACTTMGFQGPKPLTHPQFASKIPFTQFIRGAPAFLLLWRSVVKSLTHRQDSSPFGSLSKLFGWTRGSNQGARRRKRVGGEEESEE